MSKNAVAAFAGVAAVVVLAACDKSGGTSSGGGAVSAEPPPVSSSAPVASAPASSPASAALAASPAAIAPSASTAPAATTATSAKAKDAGAAAKAVRSHVDGKNFGLDLASAGCKLDAECAMTIRLVASGEWHINKQYPYKFVAAPAPGVTYLGKGDANVFGRASGDFHDEGEKAATVTVRFKPTAAGEAKISGTYKMSVCSADQCQIETPTVSLAVPVM